MGVFSGLMDAIRTKVFAYYGTATKSTPWSREVYEQETVRAIIDCIATHAAKAEAMHVVLDKDGRIKISIHAPRVGCDSKSIQDTR